MQKKLSVIGNSLGVIIDRPILELLGIDRNTTLELHTDGEALVIRPVLDERERRVRDAARRAVERHAKAFEKLAR